MDINEVRNILRKDVAKVIFIKANGKRRTMNCTLKSEYLPEISGSSSIPSQETVTVWDTEKNAWRAFRMDRMKSFQSNGVNYVVE